MEHDWAVTDLVKTAQLVATTLGMQVDEPEFLRSTNNTVLWLRPSPVVAKIAPNGDNRLSWEHAIASSLYRCGGPVVGPLEIGGLALHTSDGYEMTFWPYHPQDGSQPSSAAMADALQAMHRAVDRVAEEERLPSWDVGPQDVLSRLDDHSFASTLEEGDRRLLRSALARYPEIPSTSASTRGLHGSPHGFNVLMVEGEVRFIDLESVCLGPVEWDLAYVEPSVASLYRPGFSSHALGVARLVVSASVAAWCWEGMNRGPDMRFQAEHHLAAVRAASDLAAP
jgi:Ser/Thr protein kinase RdoA (MazF antagonist)